MYLTDSASVTIVKRSTTVVVVTDNIDTPFVFSDVFDTDERVALPCSWSWLMGDELVWLVGRDKTSFNIANRPRKKHRADVSVRNGRGDGGDGGLLVSLLWLVLGA